MLFAIIGTAVSAMVFGGCVYLLGKVSTIISAHSCGCAVLHRAVPDLFFSKFDPSRIFTIAAT